MLHGIIFIAFALLYVQLPSEGDPGFETGQAPETQVAASIETGCPAPRCSERNLLAAEPASPPASRLWEFARSGPWMTKAVGMEKVPINRVVYGTGFWVLPIVPQDREPMQPSADGDKSIHESIQKSDRPMRVCSEADAGAKDRLSIFDGGLTGTGRWVGEMSEGRSKSGI